MSNIFNLGRSKFSTGICYVFSVAMLVFCNYRVKEARAVLAAVVTARRWRGGGGPSGADLLPSGEDRGVADARLPSYVGGVP